MAQNPNIVSRKPGERMVKTLDGLEYAFRWCPAGTFTMGSPLKEAGRCEDEIPHEVTLTRGFWMLETPVTQAMWERVTRISASRQRDRVDPNWAMRGEGTMVPIYYVNWVECRNFCTNLSKKLSAQVTLPTEAQWEYACRAGSVSAHAGNVDKMAWHFGNSKGVATYQAGQKTPNKWGIYDMHGNVWEWCADWYGPYSEEPASDSKGPSIASCRVCRGGSWAHDPLDCRSASRLGIIPTGRSFNLGFRIVLTEPEE